MGGEAAAGTVDWLEVRASYVDGATPVKEIAARHGIGTPRIHEKARAERWPRRNVAASPVKRLKALVQQRLGDLETTMGRMGDELTASTNERDIRAMSLLARTLDKVLELERKHRAANAKRRTGARAVDDARRRELARRLDGLCQEPAAP
jgi:uncharacterized protein YjcR